MIVKLTKNGTALTTSSANHANLDANAILYVGMDSIHIETNPAGLITNGYLYTGSSTSGGTPVGIGPTGAANFSKIEVGDLTDNGFFRVVLTSDPK